LGYPGQPRSLRLDRDGQAAALSAETREAYLGQVPLRRIGTPEDVAAVVRFLASDGASYITGQVIHVNGGLYM